MAEKTGISWCEHSLNWWWGCTEVTSACDNCYAREWAARLKGMAWGDDAPRIKTKSAPSDLRKWDRKARTANVMRRVFAHSMSDVFDAKVENTDWRKEEFEAWRNTTNLWFLVLTKRPTFPKHYNYPFEKVWLGTSIGQDKDISMARRIIENPAKLHWISYEPAIGPLDVDQLPSAIKWLVIGGESGKNARPFHLEWAFDAINKIHRHQYPMKIFMKQLGAKPFYHGKPYPISDSHGKILGEWPAELRMQEFPL